MTHTDRREQADVTIGMLAKRFPKCFAVYERARRPLALKIHLDILAAMDIAPADLGLAMKVYCANTLYLKACVEGAERIALDGTWPVT